MIILITEYLIIIKIAKNLIINPMKGGIPPNDKSKTIILILSFPLIFIKELIDLIFIFFKILTSIKII